MADVPPLGLAVYQVMTGNNVPPSDRAATATVTAYEKCANNLRGGPPGAAGVPL